MTVEAIEVRKPAELADLDGLVIPGGESTTLLKLMDEWGFVPALEKFHAAGKPLFGTCAGLILLARGVPPGSDRRAGHPSILLRNGLASRRTSRGWAPAVRGERSNGATSWGLTPEGS